MGDGTDGAFPLLSAEVSQEAVCVQTYPLYHSFTHSFIHSGHHDSTPPAEEQ